MNTKPTQYLINILLYTEPKVRSQRHRWSKSYGPINQVWHGPAYWCICSLVTAWCQLYIFIVSNYIQRLRPTFWVCSRWEFYLKTWIAQALSRMCAIWNIKHIFIFIHICYFMFGFFFFKINMKIYLKNNLFIHLFCKTL